MRHRGSGPKLCFAILAGVTIMAGTADASPPALTGEWGGPQVHLSLGDTGGTMEFSCASARIEAPVHPDAAGKFTVKGHHEAFSNGPTPADALRPITPAHFTGHVDGNTLHLSVHRPGATAENYTLERGRRTKMIRCV